MAVDVSAIIASADDRATTLASSAGLMMEAIADRIISVGLPANPTLSLPDLAIPDMPVAPTITTVDVPTLPALTAAPTVQAITDGLSSVVVPTAPTANLPTVQAPNRPAELRSFGETAPILNTSPAVPLAPAAFAGSPPTLSTITLPSAPSRSAPGFSGSRPGDFAGVAPAAKTELETSYRSASPLMIATLESQLDAKLAQINPQYDAQLARIESKLAEYIDNPNGTGLTPAVENAIYERSKSKVNAETQRVQSDALLSAARRGFTLPTGALMSALQQARQSGADNNAKASVEIAVMQAEMQQKNMQFALSLSADLRKSALSSALTYHQNLISINGQAVQYAQSVVDALVKTFDLQVRAYSVKLEGYKADASVFETLVQASLKEVEIYKAQLEGERTKVEVDNARVRIYQAQIEAHQASVTTYSKNIDALVALSTFERMKLDVFRVEVEAYSAEVQAKSAEWGAYSAAWNGEESKIKAYMASAQVYSAQVEGYRARVAAEGTRIQALSATNQAQLEAYSEQVRAYGAQAQANASVVAAKINAQESLVKAYQVGSQAAIAVSSATAEQYRAMAQVQLGLLHEQTTKAIEETRLNVGLSQSNAQIALGAGQVYAGMASAALAGVNTLASATLSAS